MALITIPTIPAKGANLRLLRGDSAVEMMDGGVTIVAPPKAVWLLSFPLRPQRITAMRAWASALAQLSKLGNTFQAYPPGWVQGAGYSGSTPQVAGADQLGLALDIDNATVSSTLGLEGDFCEVNGEFKILTADAVSDGSGTTTINFEPALRQAPPDNDPVDFVTPKVTMRLVESVMDIEAQLSNLYGTTINAVEFYGP